MSYPLVNIVNSTNYSASGTVEYASAFCSNDNWGAGAGQPWTASSRGGCLGAGVTANLAGNGTTIQATAYSSSGTSYSQFALIQTGFGNPPTFEVTRRVSGTEDAQPEDYEEPTTQQKQ